jgi:hypothetical protein
MLRRRRKLRLHDAITPSQLGNLPQQGPGSRFAETRRKKTL